MSKKNVANNNPQMTTWNMDMAASTYQGRYGNNQPDPTMGDCMYVERMASSEPMYQWKFAKCKEKMAFICMRPSCPTGQHKATTISIFRFNEFYFFKIGMRGKNKICEFQHFNNKCVLHFNTLTVCGPSDGKEVKDVFGCTGARVEVGSAR